MPIAQSRFWHEVVPLPCSNVANTGRSSVSCGEWSWDIALSSIVPLPVVDITMKFHRILCRRNNHIWYHIRIKIQVKSIFTLFIFSGGCRRPEISLNPKMRFELDNVLPRTCTKRNTCVRNHAFQSRFHNVWSINREANNVLYQCQRYKLRVEWNEWTFILSVGELRCAHKICGTMGAVTLDAVGWFGFYFH